MIAVVDAAGQPGSIRVTAGPHGVELVIIGDEDQHPVILADPLAALGLAARSAGEDW